MSKGNENTLVWAPLRNELIKLGSAVHYQRFEDKLTPGIPDLNIKFRNGLEAWVELKYVVAPAPSNIVNIGLRREQYIWMREGKLAGRLCYLLARIGSIWYLWSDEFSWNLAKHPCLYREVAQRGVSYPHPSECLQYISQGGRRVESRQLSLT